MYQGQSIWSHFLVALITGLVVCVLVSRREDRKRQERKRARLTNVSYQGLHYGDLYKLEADGDKQASAEIERRDRVYATLGQG